MNYYKDFNFKEADKFIKEALKEDTGKGDVTSNLLIPPNSTSKAVINVKDDGIVAGIEIFKEVFKVVDKNIRVKFYVEEGEKVRKGKMIGEVKGNTRNLLKGERTALNILQRMSGIATQTDMIIRKLNNRKIRVIDTRKTTPNMRLFEKAAVKIGGGENHRFGLYDMMLIKDNHIEANGGIAKTIEFLKQKKRNSIKVEIEVKNLEELKAVLDSPPGLINRVMLDNFSLGGVQKAIKLNNKRFELEVSGGVNERNISRYKNIKGLDFISVGALTHSVKSLDISLDFIA